MSTAPDVLLNLKFDETTARGYMNIANLDPDSVNYILKLIESDKFNREKKKQQKQDEPKVIGDELTKQLLDSSHTADKYKQYDEIIAQQVVEQQKHNKPSIEKRAFNEFQYIDDRIRAINKITEQIGSDYRKLGKLADKLDDLVQLREIIESKVKKQEHTVDIPRMRIDETVLIEPSNGQLDENELSELRKSEEPKLQGILGSSIKKEQIVLLDLTNRSSISEVLEDVLDEFNEHKSHDQVYSDRPDLSRSKSPRKSPKNANRVLDKRKMSPTVQREKEMQDRRDLMKEKYAEMREQEAKKLLKEILLDEVVMSTVDRKSRKETVTTKPKKKTRIKQTPALSPASPPPPPLELGQITINNSLQSRNQSREPSLMACTIADLQRKEAIKKAQSEFLMRSLESRFSSPPHRKSISPPQRLLKSFTSIVRLQDPAKLRQNKHKPLTYQEQLRTLQMQTVQPPDPTSLAEMKKVYGSKRVKMAGAKMSTRRPQHPLVKTYAERLQELKPAQLNTRVVPGYKPYTIINVERELDSEELSEWSLDNKLKNIIYGDEVGNNAKPATISRQKTVVLSHNKNKWTVEKLLQNDNELAQLFEDELKNEVLVHNALKDLEELDKLEDRKLNGNDDYVDNVDIDEILNISISTESSNGYINWDELSDLLGKHK